MTTPTPDRTPTADLRERLAEALTREHYRRARERIEASLEEHCAAFADAVLSVVEAETAALRQRAEEAERERDEALAAVQRVRTLGQNLADGLDPDGHDDDAAEVGSRILRTLDHSKESSR